MEGETRTDERYTKAAEKTAAIWRAWHEYVVEPVEEARRLGVETRWPRLA